MAVDAAAPDWLDPTFVQSLSLPIGKSEVRVALREGMPARELPEELAVGGVNLRLKACREPRVLLQSAVRVERETGTRLLGTAAALVADQRNASRHYLLTCGHVAAPDANARHSDGISVQAGQALRGYLVEWQPTFGQAVLRTPLDAALVEISPADARQLGRTADWLPRGVGGPPRRDTPLTMRAAAGPVDGVMKVFWSGAVDIPNVTPGIADYFLEEAVGYLSSNATHAGDSGAPIWDQDEKLIGMHLGAVQGGDGEVNAVFGQIAPVLEWFGISPWLRDGLEDSMLVLANKSIGATRVAPMDPQKVDDARTVVAQTLWGEARGEGELGMRAVAAVIENRRAMRHRGCTTAAQVCLSYAQFSCWNDGDPNRARMQQVVLQPDDAYRAAFAIAGELLGGRLFIVQPDPTHHATHYVASTLRNRPRWLRGRVPCVVIGRHEFYKDID